MKIIEAATAYGAKFRDCPTIVGLPVSVYDKAALLMQEAIERGTKIADADFRAELGLETPEVSLPPTLPDADT